MNETVPPSAAENAAAAFWPDPPAVAPRPHGGAPQPFVAWMRHAPDTGTLARALDRFGEPARPLLEAWTDLVAGAVGDVEALAARLDGSGEEPEMRKAAQAALRDLSTFDPRVAAELALALEAQPSVQAGRDKAFHVLEDALILTELTRHGASFAIVANPFALSPVVIAGGPGEPPRLLDPAGRPEEQARHAGAVRALRAVVEAPFPYWSSRAFQAACGRDLALAHGPAHLAAILSDMRAQGHDKAFLKHARSKRGTWAVDLPDGGIRAAALAAHAVMGPAYDALARPASDLDNQVLVQDFVPFTHEHRFLVVGHRVVASTASDRAIGVLDRPNRRLHPGVARLAHPAFPAGAYDRGASDTVIDRGLVAAMARVALRTVAALRREGIAPADYCLDVGLSARGVLPIEVNTLSHCGLYAAEWGRVARALALRPVSGFLPVVREIPARDGRNPVDDALDFILDFLLDEPPTELARVAAILSGLALERDPVGARALGIVARDRSRREDERAPPHPDLLAAAKAYLARRDG